MAELLSGVDADELHLALGAVIEARIRLGLREHVRARVAVSVALAELQRVLPLLDAAEELDVLAGSGPSEEDELEDEPEDWAGDSE